MSKSVESRFTVIVEKQVIRTYGYQFDILAKDYGNARLIADTILRDKTLKEVYIPEDLDLLDTEDGYLDIVEIVRNDEVIGESG